MSTSMRLSAPLALVLAFAAILAAPAGAADTRNDFVTLCYHEVVPETCDLVLPDAMPVWVSQLADHFDWIRDNGFTVIGVDDILAARRGERDLPEKSIFLTFDDGLTSFRRFVYPMLQAYKYKAMLALETTWLETPEDQPVMYGDNTHLPRSYFMTWEQIKEVADSGLVELAGHSHNLHLDHVSMPQDAMQPSGATLAYNRETGIYETPQEFYQRVKEDVVRNAQIIFERTGHRPRLLVWPYGHYRRPGVEAVLEAGYELTASLGFFADRDVIPRFLMYHNITMQDAMNAVTRGVEGGSSAFTRPGIDSVHRDLLLPVYDPQRIMHVDLDYVYDPDPEQQYRNVSALFDRVVALGANTVYLQAFSDPDGNGTASGLYFPNRHLPMRADLFNYVAWQLLNRYGAKVYAWMPVLGFEIPGRPLVTPSQPGKAGSSYRRLTPFDGENRRVIGEIYQDLAMHSLVEGVLYHDDAVLGDYEDASPAARAWLDRVGLDGRSFDEIRGDPESMRRFTGMKTRYLMDFTNELAKGMEEVSRVVLTARNVYAPVVLAPESEAWFGQNFADFLENYDYVALMAMPYMEGAGDHPDAWLEKLAAAVKHYPAGAQKTVFELQAVDWRDGRQKPIPSATLARQMLLLQTNGIGNLGYYPENPIDNHPDVNVIYPAFSLQENRFLRNRYAPAPAPAAPAPRYWLPPDIAPEASLPAAGTGAGTSYSKPPPRRPTRAARAPGVGSPGR